MTDYFENATTSTVAEAEEVSLDTIEAALEGLGIVRPRIIVTTERVISAIRDSASVVKHSDAASLGFLPAVSFCGVPVESYPSMALARVRARILAKDSRFDVVLLSEEK